MIAATIGCETLPGGVYGLGAKRLHVLIDEQNLIDATALVGIVIAAKKGRVTEAELLVVIDALMHEPCNTIELSTKKKQPKAATIRTSLNLQVSGQTLVESQEIYDDILVLKLCGWMGTSELPVWAGAISDTEYQTRSGVFEYYMQRFVDHLF